MKKWQEQLRAAKAELTIRHRTLRAAERAFARCLGEISKLENKIENYMARVK